LRRSLGFLACIVALVAMTGCSRYGGAKPPASAQDPPIYAGAQAIQTQTVASHLPEPTKLLSFRTIASPATVIAFYRDTLLRDGWRVEDQENPNEAHFYWVEGCPVYGLTVSATSSLSDQTSVQLELIETPCH